jgi:hypothetical protein
LETLLEATQDSWVVLYVEEVLGDGAATGIVSYSAILETAEQLQKVLVTHCDVAVFGARPTTENTADPKFTYSLRLHRGNTMSSAGQESTSPDGSVSALFKADMEGVLFPETSTGIDATLQFIQQQMHSGELLAGSVSSLTVLVQGMFARANNFLR